MEKEGLEKAILNCKPAVLKAKVRVVRKLIKKINILRKCKDPALKEKKLKKASRVLEEIITINRLKVFDVISFGLRTKNLDNVLNTPSNERLHAFAVLAKFNDVTDQVNKLRKKFKDETALVDLLNSLENDRKSKIKIKTAKKKAEGKNEKKSVKKKKKAETKCNLDGEKVKKEAKSNSAVDLEKDNVVKPKLKKQVKNNKLDNNLKISQNKTNTKKINNEQVQDNKKIKIEVVKVHSDNPVTSKVSSNDSNEEKIDDPFFVGKKIIKPKFIDADIDQNDSFDNEDDKVLDHSNNLKQRSRDSLWKMNESNDSGSKPYSNKKPEKRKMGSTHKSLTKEEDLHPSWAAKKSIQPIIQTFQGKKIKFED